MENVRTAYDKSVFINCPFDGRYERIFRALVFAICDCGFIPRSALEAANEPFRFNRIIEIIRESRYAIHDLSRSGIDGRTGLARFNMPLELGIFLGAKEFGSRRQIIKTFVILDRDPYRYLKSISDLKGIDPKPHNNNPGTAILKVRNWLNDISEVDFIIPSGDIIAKRYKKFKKDLPYLAKAVHLRTSDLTYRDYCYLIQEWLTLYAP